MSSFFSRIKDVIIEARTHGRSIARGVTGPGRMDTRVHVRLADLEELIRDYERMDEHFRRQHNLKFVSDNVIVITGGTLEERDALINVLLMQLVLAGYSPTGTPTWQEGESYLPVVNTNKPRLDTGQDQKKATVINNPISDYYLKPAQISSPNGPFPNGYYVLGNNLTGTK